MSAASNNFFWYKFPAFLWAIIIWILLTMPGKSLPSINIWNFDKLAHAGVFFLQALLLYRALMFPTPILILKKIKPFIATAVFTFLYGSLSEIYQSLIPDRTPDVKDAIANTFGLILFALVLFLWERRKRNSSLESSASKR